MFMLDHVRLWGGCHINTCAPKAKAVMIASTRRAWRVLIHEGMLSIVGVLHALGKHGVGIAVG